MESQGTVSTRPTAGINTREADTPGAQPLAEDRDWRAFLQAKGLRDDTTFQDRAPRQGPVLTMFGDRLGPASPQTDQLWLAQQFEGVCAAKKHQTLLQQENFLASASSKQQSLPSKCYQCSADHSELLVCGGCKTVKFCGAACAKAAWKGHKHWCKKLAALQQGPFSLSLFFVFLLHKPPNVSCQHAAKFVSLRATTYACVSACACQHADTHAAARHINTRTHLGTPQAQSLVVRLSARRWTSSSKCDRVHTAASAFASAVGLQSFVSSAARSCVLFAGTRILTAPRRWRRGGMGGGAFCGQCATFHCQVATKPSTLNPTMPTPYTLALIPNT